MQQEVNGVAGFLEPRQGLARGTARDTANVTTPTAVAGRPAVAFLEFGADDRGWRRVGLFVFDGDTGRRAGFFLDDEALGEICLHRVQAAKDSGWPLAAQQKEFRLGYVVQKVASRVGDLADLAPLIEYPVQLSYSGTGAVRATPAADAAGTVPGLPPAWQAAVLRAMRGEPAE